MRTFFHSITLKEYMKTVLFIAFCVVALNTVGQSRAELKNDTIFYQSRTFAVGDTIQLAYGSGANKNFAFVYLGSGMMGWHPLAASFSKYRVLIKKVQEARGKTSFVGLPVDDRAINALGNGKILVDVEGAIDNKELL